jgi:hypothetical protein
MNVVRRRINTLMDVSRLLRREVVNKEIIEEAIAGSSTLHRRLSAPCGGRGCGVVSEGRVRSCGLRSW